MCAYVANVLLSLPSAHTFHNRFSNMADFVVVKIKCHVYCVITVL